MHDQRKVREELDAHTASCRLAEVSQFAEEYNRLLQQRRGESTVHKAELMQEISALLHKAPHAYTMYNYRREVLLRLLSEGREEQVAIRTTTEKEKKEKETTMEKKKIDWLKEELKFSASVILCDHKGYAAFLHRKWVFMQIRQLAEGVLTSTREDSEKRESQSRCGKEYPEEVCFWVSALLKEKKQCENLLAVDERNFHAWNYRRWVLEELNQMEKVLLRHSIMLTDIMGTINHTSEKKPGGVEQPQEKEEKQQSSLFTSDELKELNFTTAMVRRNFSNYSAWHQRGVIFRTALQRLHNLTVVHENKNSNNNNSGSSTREMRHNDNDNEKTNINHTNNSSTEAGESNCGYCTIMKEAWSQISTDLSLLIAAVYCDPLDQSAWYYAQFLEQAAQSLQKLSMCSSYLSTPVDVTGQLINACTELIAEEQGSGEMESSWPRLYVLNALIAAHKKKVDNGDEKNNDKKEITMIRMVDELARKVYTALHPNDVWDENNNNNNNIDDGIYTRCVKELVTQLVQTDPLRAGMYNSLLADALSPQTREEEENTL